MRLTTANELNQSPESLIEDLSMAIAIGANFKICFRIELTYLDACFRAGFLMGFFPSAE